MSRGVVVMLIVVWLLVVGFVWAQVGTGAALVIGLAAPIAFSAGRVLR